MRYGKSLLYLLLVPALFAWMTRCAHPVAPTGGPQDMKPPAVKGTDPPNYSTHFQASEIEIEFDEFIQVKDAAKEIYTSPPMLQKPEFKVHGKTLVVDLKEELRKDLTYVINFGSAIVDITENNPAKGLSYVFSTGATIDSLSFSGKIVNAADLKPVENILFAVYSDGMDTIPLDSMPVKIPPLSAIRSTAEGSFRLTNLPGGEYLVIALEDLNNNFYYDMPTERIGFLDTLVMPEYLEEKKDTVGEGENTDIRITVTGSPKNPLTLYLFQAFDSTQRLLSSSFTSHGSMVLAFRLPLDDYTVTPINFPDSADWYLAEHSRLKDTLILWPRDIQRDTFELHIQVGEMLSDTTRLIRKRADTDSGRKKTREKSGLDYKANLSAGILEPGSDLLLTFTEPLASWDFTHILLTGGGDSLVPPISFADSVKRRIKTNYSWKENETYRLVIPDSALLALSGAQNDSLVISFKTRPVTDYGSVIMNFVLPDSISQYIAELINDKGAVIDRQTLKSSQKISYLYLKPGTYKLKIIIDENQNGQWDPGNFHRRVQPEKVLYYPKEISTRANWELQEEWRLNE